MKQVVILVDPLSGQDPRSQALAEALRAEVGEAARVLPCPDREALRGAAELAARADVVGVTGGDAGLSAAWTALWRLGAAQVPLAPMGGGRWDLVRRQLGGAGWEPGRVASALASWARRGPGLLRRGPKVVTMPSLRVVDSAQPHAHLGFTWGAGTLYQGPGGGGVRASLKALSRELRAGSVERARVVADGQAALEGFQLLALSALGQAPGRLRSLEPPPPGRLWMRWSAHAVGSAALALPVGPLQGDGFGAQQVGRVLVDLPPEAGYRLDGAAVAPTAGGLALEISPGPVSAQLWLWGGG